MAENPNAFGRGKRTAIIDQKLRQDTTAEEKRKSHQKELMEKMNAQALKRIKEGGNDKEEKKVGECNFFSSTKDEVFLKDNGRTTVKSLKKG